jgi:hypothetical protein
LSTSTRGASRESDETTITGTFPETGTAHLDVVFEAQGTSADNGNRIGCRAKARFSVQPSS